MRRLALALLGVILLSGCGNATAIDNRAITVALAVDRGSNGKLSYTFQMPTPQSLGGGGTQSGGGSSFYYPSAEAASFAEAISVVEDRTSRDVYLGQMQVVMISLDVPPQSRDRFLAELTRIGETDRTEWLSFTEGSAAKILPAPQGQEELPAVYYATHFDCRTCQSSDMSMRLWRAMANLDGSSHATMIPVISRAAGQTSIERVAAFGYGTPPVVLSAEETMTAMMLFGKATKAVLDVKTPLGDAVVRSLAVRSSRRAELVAGRLELADQVEAHGQVAQKPASVLRLTQVGIRTVADAVAAKIAERATSLISHLQAAGVDPLAFGDYLHLHDANALQSAGAYSAAFRSARFTIHVSVTLPAQGTSV